MQISSSGITCSGACGHLIKEEFDKDIWEFEEILQKIAGAVASGFISEKLSPSNLLEKTENYVDHLTDLTIKTEKLMLILKPEKAHIVKARSKNLTQTLTTYKNILVQNTPEPPANSRLAFEQLRKALTDGSDFLFLMREVRDNPSPLISAVLAFNKTSDTKGSAVNVHASEGEQPLIKYVTTRMEEFRDALVDLERKVGEMKESMRELEENLKALSSKTSEQPEASENKTEKRQLPLSNFKAEQN
jgi:hypothetical protein